MKKVIYLFISLTVFFPNLVLAGGYFGNGGGLVEQNFNFAYSSLPRIIESALFTLEGQFDEREKATLEKIIEIAQDNTSNPKRLVFLSGEKHPDLFTTGPNEPFRLAVTSNTPGDTIFLNGDFFYSEEGIPQFFVGEMMSILTHEVGHQTGELDHKYLDVLGSKIRNYYAQNNRIYDIERNGELLSFSTINQKGYFQSAQLFYQNEKKVTNLTGVIVDLLNIFLVEKNYSTLTGFSLMNGNFKFEYLPTRYVFQVWVSANYVYSINGTASTKNELFPVEFEIQDDNSLRMLSLERSFIEF